MAIHGKSDSSYENQPLTVRSGVCLTLVTTPDSDKHNQSDGVAMDRRKWRSVKQLNRFPPLLAETPLPARTHNRPSPAAGP